VLLEQIQARGARRLALVFDEEIYGRELAGELVARARRDGPAPVASEEYYQRVEDIPDIARSLSKAGPDAVAYAGVAGPGTGRLLAAIDLRMPGTPVFATSGMLARDPANPSAAAGVRARRRGAAGGGVRLRGHAPRAGRDRRAGPDRQRVLRRALEVRERRSRSATTGCGRRATWTDSGLRSVPCETAISGSSEWSSDGL
jgi:hypothetical protein